MRKLKRAVTVFSIVVLFALLFCGWRIIVNNQEINAIHQILQSEIMDPDDKDALRTKIRKLEIESSNLLRVIDYQTTWSTLYVSLLFVIFGIFGYSVFINFITLKFNEIMNKVNQKTKQYDQGNKLHEAKLQKLYEDSLFDAGNLYSTMVRTFFADEFASAVVCGIRAAHCFYSSNNKEINNLEQIAFNNLQTVEENILTMLKNNNNAEKSKLIRQVDRLRPKLMDISTSPDIYLSNKAISVLNQLNSLLI